ncbi:response regulator transcription factor [Pararhodobacter sp. CCB-MM2]|uniref:LuxR C-terminal-related transcriptional regulator n=1 Tax=Pararhodobacter sp. CCB-MM2 TaxID=1786003 RepID=UPI00083531FC|nr:response regulator transcription factor [Pararhodobacter sp. CCB-MM2]
MERKKIIIIDDHPIVLSGIEDILSASPTWKVVGRGTSAADMPGLLEQHKPHIAIVDLHLPGNILREIKAARDLYLSLNIVVFTASDNVADCNAVMDAGARAYVLKGSDVRDLFRALDYATQGREFVSPEVATKLMREMRLKREAPERERNPLNYRESQIMESLLLGSSNKDIAEKLSLSEKTVKHYMTGILQKMNATSRLEAVVRFQEILGNDASGHDASYIRQGKAH